MFCTRCGANNLEADQFCRSCSAPLVKPGGAQSQSGHSGSTPYPYSASAPTQVQPPSQSDTPYPQYQGYPPPAQYGYANQMSGQQGGASGRAIAALVLSVIALISCCFGWPFGVIGIVLGKMEMNAIRDGRAPQSGETLAKVGFYLGIAATAISLLVTAIYFFSIFANIATSSDNY
jgi:Domain of unknown function (DUF4190)